MLQRIYLIFSGPVDQTEIGAGFVIEYLDQPIVFRLYNSAVMSTDTVWSSDTVRRLAICHLHQAGIHGTVVASALPD